MSLEKALEANTAAVLALTESNDEVKHQLFHLIVELSRFADCTLAPAAAFTPAPKKQEEKASAPSKAKAAPVAETPASTAAEPDAATSTLTYDDIKVPFLNLAKSDLAAAQALIAEFGFRTLKDAKPEQYAEILRALTPDSEEGMA